MLIKFVRFATAAASVVTLHSFQIFLVFTQLFLASLPNENFMISSKLKPNVKSLSKKETFPKRLPQAFIFFRSFCSFIFTYYVDDTGNSVEIFAVSVVVVVVITVIIVVKATLFLNADGACQKLYVCFICNLMLLSLLLNCF